MTLPFVKLHNVTFSYPSSAELLFKDLTLHFTPGWTGVVGPNGSGKTTLLKLATRILTPICGHVEIQERVVYCAQRTDLPPDRFTAFITGPDRNANIIKGRLGIEDDWLDRWQTLSHGERKRAQIGVALWLEPDILAIDEPTNHVDADARRLLNQALFSYSGVGLLVSHDRDLLDALCEKCAFVEPPNVIIRKGGYTKGKTLATEEQEAIRKQKALKKKAYKKLKKEAGKRRDLANHADRRLSKKGIPKEDHAAKGKIDAARVTGKDGVGGKLLRQLDGRLSRAENELAEMKAKKEYAMGIWLSGSRSNRNTLLDIQDGKILLGNGKCLHHPRLIVRPDDRIGITGQNGSGKSTLLNHILPHLNVEPASMTYVPQEIDLKGSQDILNAARTLPPEQKGHLMTIVSRLGSRPHRLLESTTPSPGETRKLMLALGMTRTPHVIIMDEPTNHMDLPSIECLEQALATCPCGMVLISHDVLFLRHLTCQRWHISKTSENVFCLKTE